VAAIGLTRNAALDDAATADRTSHVGEPSVAALDEQIFVTGNWYASRSTDGGASWTHVDPFTALPSAAGGFCCDQLVLHEPRRGLWIWLLQYVQRDDGANVFRIAVARDADFAAGVGWYWWDIAPTAVDASWTGLWFDYPDAAITDGHLGISFNLFAGETWRRAAVMRFPLDALAAGGGLDFTWWATTDHGSLRLTQGGGPTLWWASHTSGRRLRLFSWPDAESTVTWWDVGVTAWSGTITSTAPNGVDWLGRCDPRITAGWVAGGAAGFLWTAGPRAGRPHPHCRAVTIDLATKAVTAEPDLWSEGAAWAYPAAAPNAAGVVGLTAFHGGGGRHPGHAVGARDGEAWRMRYSRAGSHSPAVPAWGDYLNCRAEEPGGDGWVASGYTLEGGEQREAVVPRVVQFRLEPS